MDSLVDNALMRMPGPTFLAFYGIVAVMAIILFNLLVYFDDGDRRPPPPLPQRPDPYEMAFLRDGLSGVIGVALYALKRAGAIEMLANGRLAVIGGPARPRDPIEEAVLREIDASGKARDLPRASSARAEVAPLFAARERRLDALGLLNTPQFSRRVVGFALPIGFCLFALAAVKIDVAIGHGHRNVGFLVLETGIALIALAANASAIARRTANARGRAYLDQMKIAYHRETPSADPAANWAALALVGAYGFEVLRDGPDAAFAQQMRRHVGGGDGGGGGGDGGSGCGGGGGCGGCGGGG
jgi:uncharacterized protein (TIGR04222 family)